MKCPKCGADNPDYDMYCGRCAGELPESPADNRSFCVNCGKQNPEGQKYCGNCGADLDSEFPIVHTHTEEPKEDWRPASTWSGWLNQMFWYKLGLPPRGLSTLKFALYVILLAGASLALLVLGEGPIGGFLMLFIVADFVVIGLIMYWVYATNR